MKNILIIFKDENLDDVGEVQLPCREDVKLGDIKYYILKISPVPENTDHCIIILEENSEHFYVLELDSNEMFLI